MLEGIYKYSVVAVISYLFYGRTPLAHRTPTCSHSTLMLHNKVIDTLKTSILVAGAFVPGRISLGYSWKVNAKYAPGV